MKNKIYLSIALSFLLFFPLSAFSQDITKKKDEGISESTKEIHVLEKEKSEHELFQAALVAKQKGEFEKALYLLSEAYNKKKNVRYLFERALVLEQMGEKEFALNVLDENMEALRNHPDIPNFALTRERISQMKGIDEKEKSLKKKIQDEVPKEGSTLGPFLMGGGILSVLGGIALFVVSNAAENDILCTGESASQSPACDNPTTTFKAQEQERYDKANLTNMMGWSFTAVGVALTSVGTYLWLNESTSLSTTMYPIHNNFSVRIKTTW